MMPAGPAFVLLTEDGRDLVRSAALVYRTQSGLGWLELGYFDPYPPERAQWHERDGRVLDIPEGLVLDGEQTRALVLDAAAVRGTEMDRPELQEEFADLERRLAAVGSSLAEQRLLLATQLPGVTG